MASVQPRGAAKDFSVAAVFVSETFASGGKRPAGRSTSEGKFLCVGENFASVVVGCSLGEVYYCASSLFIHSSCEAFADSSLGLFMS